MDLKFITGIRQVKAISDYQFGKQVTDILFKNIQDIQLKRSRSTNKIRYVYHHDNLLLTLRPNNGFFTLSFYSANIIIKNCIPPKMRVIVLNDISEYIEKGRNVFCKHVVEVDEDLRPLDEVIVVNQNDKLLAIGRLKLPVSYVKSFTSGVAVIVRKGTYKSKI
jgi:predicted RNA-binding protein (TIGR00451 family)